MRPRRNSTKFELSGEVLMDLLTFNRLLTGPVVHLIYWAGLGVIVLVGFGIAGAGVGLAIREGNFLGVLLAIPVFVLALLAMAIMTLLWRAFCEFYVAVFRISDDLRALRESNEVSTSGRPPSDAGPLI